MELHPPVCRRRIRHHVVQDALGAGAG